MNPERINIKDLTIEEPQKEEGLVFDPEWTITQDEYDQLSSELGHYGFVFFLDTVSDIKTLNPNLDLKLTGEKIMWARNKLKQCLNEAVSNGKWQPFLHHAMSMKTAGLGHHVHLNQEALEGIEDLLEHYRQAKSWGEFAGAAATVKIIDPSVDISIDKETREKIKPGPINVNDKESLTAVLIPTLWARILDPETKLQLDPSVMEAIKQKMEECKTHHQWRELATLGSTVKIIIAEKVTMTDAGWDLVMPEKKESLEFENVSIPEKRNF